MIELNKEYNVVIKDEDNKGNGITRINDFVLFVPNSFKDEELTIKVIKLSKRFGIGSLVKIIKPSSRRSDIKCKYYNECGGCSFLHMSYEEEKNKKTSEIKKIFNAEIDKVYFGKESNYRNKATFHVSNNELGYYSEDSHDLVSFDNCLLLDERINNIYNYLNKSNLDNLSSVIVRVTDKELMIIFDNEYDYSNLIREFKIDSIYINDKLVYGKKYITEVIDGVSYTISPDSFFQVNYESMKHLYDVIKEYSGHGNKLLDLYCGTGTIGIYLKDNFKSITGIEVNRSSINNANINKDINNLDNIKFILGDSKIASKDDYDVIIVDPPRNGLSHEVINYLNKTNSKIIYVSCNPITLKRDIDELNNYKITKLSIVNMFPRTKHVETVVLMTKKND